MPSLRPRIPFCDIAVPRCEFGLTRTLRAGDPGGASTRMCRAVPRCWGLRGPRLASRADPRLGSHALLLERRTRRAVLKPGNTSERAESPLPAGFEGEHHREALRHLGQAEFPVRPFHHVPQRPPLALRV